jgi:hypothetical protein
VALPLVLPMGWTESPPYFYAATETVTNMTNWRLMNRWKAPPHRLEALANTSPPPEAKGDGTPTLPVAEGPKPPFDGISTSPFAEAEGLKPPFAGIRTSPFAEGPKPPFTIPTASRPHIPTSPFAEGSKAALHTIPTTSRPHNQRIRKRPLQKVDLFVNDFIGLGQGNQAALSHIRCTLLHTLDEVFRGVDALDGPHHKEPAPTKMLRQGDAFWETRKLTLGWIINTIRMTLELPPHRKERLLAILGEIPSTQTRISVEKWQQILGEFRSMAIAVPGSRGLFSLLQEAL